MLRFALPAGGESLGLQWDQRPHQVGRRRGRRAEGAAGRAAVQPSACPRRFSVSKRIFVVGFGLYGSIHGPTDYQVNIQVRAGPPLPPGLGDAHSRSGAHCRPTPPRSSTRTATRCWARTTPASAATARPAPSASCSRSPWRSCPTSTTRPAPRLRWVRAPGPEPPRPEPRPHRLPPPGPRFPLRHQGAAEGDPRVAHHGRQDLLHLLLRGREQQWHVGGGRAAPRGHLLHVGPPRPARSSTSGQAPQRGTGGPHP